MSTENPKITVETNEGPELKSAVELAMEKTDKYAKKEEEIVTPSVEEDSGPELKSAVELAMERTARFLEEVDETPEPIAEQVLETPVETPTPAVEINLYPSQPVVPETPAEPVIPEIPTIPVTPETTPAPENAAPIVETLNTTTPPEVILAGFTPENRGFFGRMSNRAKNVASSIYEGVYKMPVVNRVVGKLEIAYNQLWLNRHEGKAVKLKGKMDDFDMKSKALDLTKGQMEGVISDLRQKNAPGLESFEMKIRDIDQKKAELMRKKDKVQTKFEKREGKMALYANDRDRVADKLIGRYSEKIAPMEKELESLSTCKDRLDLITSVTEARHNNELRALSAIERNKSQLEEGFKAAGGSEKEVRNAVKPLTDYINGERERMKKERDAITKRKAEINSKIAKTDKKANPYRDKRENFSRVKSKRPIKMNVPTRQRGTEFRGEEETEAHSRGEAPVDLGDEPEDNVVESAENETHTTAEFVSGWNSFIQEKNDKANYGEPLDTAAFFGELQAVGLNQDAALGSKDFRAILVRYYALKKLPVGKVGAKVDEFISQMA